MDLEYDLNEIIGRYRSQEQAAYGLDIDSLPDMRHFLQYQEISAEPRIDSSPGARHVARERWNHQWKASHRYGRQCSVRKIKTQLPRIRREG